MKCPECQFDNSERIKFCVECGNKLEIICPKCSCGNLPSHKFCGECGHDFRKPSEAPSKELTFEEKLTKIQKYLPKGLTEKILSQRDRIEGERKQVTVMFCDMEGFTPLSEKLGPEEAYTIMDQVYEILIHKVHDYEGTVNEFTGDGIMALFGAPIALEDAPQRAIRSAYAIHREMTTFSDKLQQEQEKIPPIKMRIGIHTGLVVVGTLGNDLRLEFKAVGDTVNMASRMEGLAESGTTYITEHTFRLTEGFFRFEALGEKSVKGKKEPIKTYRVIAPSTRRTRFEVSAERGLTPYIGRERELELLQDGFKRSKGGKGQAFSIVSEAGIGKSRLLYEFRKSIINEDATFLEGKCLSYSRGVAYYPVIDILKSTFDIREDDGDIKITEKVKKGLAILGADESSTLPYLLELLSVAESGIDQIPMSPEGRKDRIKEALKRIVIQGAEIRPLIVAIEDLHWIDQSSEDVLKDLLECISGKRVLLLFTYRPEFVHTWGNRSYHNQVNLNRLSNRESIVMASYHLATTELDKNLENLILEKTEGIPFFIEEFLKSSKELEIIQRIGHKCYLRKDISTVMIPSTIQDVILARVDTLNTGPKKVLQACSVIEREFTYELIKKVTGMPEPELLTHLSILKDSELLYERGIYPESTYIFKHTLTREVIYDSILAKRKKDLHAIVGNAIENLNRENISEHYGVLVEHFIESEDFEKGAEYSKLVSKKAAKMASLNVAIAYAKKRVEALENLDRTDYVIENIINARTALGLYTSQFGYIEEAKEAIAPILDITLRHGNKRRLSQIYIIDGAYSYMIEENFQRAFKRLEEGLKLSEEINEVISTVLANYYLGVALTLNCDFEKAFYHIEKAYGINEAVGNLWGMSVMKSHLSLPFNYQGQVYLGFQHSEKAVQLAEDSGDIFSKAMAYSLHGFSCYYKGSFADAIRHLIKGADFGERINYFTWNAVSQFYLGESHFEIGEYKKARVYYEKAVLFLENNIWLPSFMNLHKIAFSRAKLMNNEKDINIEYLCTVATKNKLRRFDGQMQRYIGEIFLNIDEGHITNSKNWIEKAIKTDKKNGVIFELGRNYALYAELFKRKGNKSKTKENLSKAIEIFSKCGADGWAEKYQKELV